MKAAMILRAFGTRKGITQAASAAETVAPVEKENHQVPAA
jgi:hypothetical protein